MSRLVSNPRSSLSETLQPFLLAEVNCVLPRADSGGSLLLDSWASPLQDFFRPVHPFFPSSPYFLLSLETHSFVIVVVDLHGSLNLPPLHFIVCVSFSPYIGCAVLTIRSLWIGSKLPVRTPSHPPSSLFFSGVSVLLSFPQMTILTYCDPFGPQDDNDSQRA